MLQQRNSTRVSITNKNNSNNNHHYDNNGTDGSKHKDSSSRRLWGRKGYSIIALSLLLIACCLLSWTLLVRRTGGEDDDLLPRWSSPVVIPPRPQVVAPELGGFEFRGASRTAARGVDKDGGRDGGPRIAVVTNAVAFPYDEKSKAVWSMFKEYFANKDCYARTHGYDLIVDSR